MSQPPEQPVDSVLNVDKAAVQAAEPAAAADVVQQPVLEQVEVEPAAQASALTSTAAAAVPEPQVHVFNPATGSSTPSEVSDAFFETTIADVQSYHESILSRSKRLNEAPLLTSKHRDEERAQREKKKAEKWPNTTIRIKFSDGTQIQSTFPSSSPIQPVYAFVRSTLDPSHPASSTSFTLYSPPRTVYPEHPAPTPKPTKAAASASLHKVHIRPPANYGHVKGDIAAGMQAGTGGAETLAELGLVPQSVLLIRWTDEAMNASTVEAPLRAELKAKSEPLPPPGPPASAAPSSSGQQPTAGASTAPKEKKIPTWLQKGLLKKK